LPAFTSIRDGQDDGCQVVLSGPGCDGDVVQDALRQRGRPGGQTSVRRR